MPWRKGRVGGVGCLGGRGGVGGVGCLGGRGRVGCWMPWVMSK